MEDVATEEMTDQFIEITVSEPHKIGEGIGSYIAYKWVSSSDKDIIESNASSIPPLQSVYTYKHFDFQETAIQCNASI